MSDISLARIDSSNLPASQKSALRRWVDGVRGGGMSRAKAHLSGGANAVRQGGEALVVGGILGAIEGQHGTLDISLSKSKPQAILPVDAAAGVIGLVGGTLLAHEEYGTDLRNAGAAAAAIFSYRKTKEFVAKRKAGVHGDIGFGADESEDPIVAAVRGV